jgi:hypothetical protein
MSEAEQKTIVAHCGLVCSDCGAFKKSKCKGCYGGKPMFPNCPIKKCNLDNHRATCAECPDFQNLKDCGKLNNLISKFFGLVFRSDRIGNLNKIREVGLEKFRADQA